jgi:hypothetical protein
MGSACFGQDMEIKLQKMLQDHLTANPLKPGSSSINIDIHMGILSIPPGFTNKRAGTADSERGYLSAGEFIIYYDIGAMSGAHMNKTLKGKCSYYSDSMYNDYRTIVGLQKLQAENKLTITVYGNDTRNFRFPANFWAAVKNDADMKTMLDIALSYRPGK